MLPLPLLAGDGLTPKETNRSNYPPQGPSVYTRTNEGGTSYTTPQALGTGGVNGHNTR